MNGPARRVASELVTTTVAYMDGNEVEVVVSHSARDTLRVGDLFLKIDADRRRIDVEVEAMARAPIPTPQVRWRRHPVLALATLPGAALGQLGEPSLGSRGRGSERANRPAKRARIRSGSADHRTIRLACLLILRC